MHAFLMTLDVYQAQHPAVFFWLDVLLKSSFILLLGLVFQLLFRRQSAASLGLVWLVVLMACLAIPLLKLFTPDLILDITVMSDELPAAAGGLRFASLITGATILYAAGTLLLALYLLAGVWRLLRLTRQSQSVTSGRACMTLQQLMRLNGMSSRVLLLVSDQATTPFTWGIIRHRVILPRQALNWDERLINQAIAHELGHIQRNDWLYQLLSRAALCLYWPNPLAWYALHALKIESEKACDDAAIDCSGSDIDYADNLLRLATESRVQMPLPVAALFGMPSMLSQRIRHILCDGKNRTFLRSDEISFTMAIILLLALPLSALKFSTSVAAQTVSSRSGLPLVFNSDHDPDATGNAGPAVPDNTNMRPPEDLHGLTLDSNPPRRHRPKLPELDQAGQAVSTDFDLSLHEMFEKWEAAPLRMPLPQYPQAALRRGIEGYVVAEYWIDAQGRVYDPIIIESVPTGTFDRAVLRAVTKFVYCPEVVDGIGGNNQLIRKRFSFNLETVY